MSDSVYFATNFFAIPMPVGWQFCDETVSPPVYRNGTKSEYYQTVIAPANSGFCGFPFPVYFGKQWAGDVISADWNRLTETIKMYGPQVLSGFCKYYNAETRTYYAPRFIRKVPQPTVPLPTADELAGCRAVLSPLQRPVIGPGTNYVGPMTLNEAFDCYWRIREWKVEVSATLSGSVRYTNYGSFGTATASTSVIADSTTLPTFLDTDAQERNLRYLNSGFFLKTGMLLVAGSGSGPGGSVGCHGGTDASLSWGLNVVCDIDSPADYYVSLIFTASATIGGSISGMGDSGHFSITTALTTLKPNVLTGLNSTKVTDLGGGYYTTMPETADYEDGPALTLTLPGGREIDIPTWMITTDSGDMSGLMNHSANPFTLAVSIDSVDLSPNSYWTYKNSDGNPVWDTDTGEKTAPVS